MAENSAIPIGTEGMREGKLSEQDTSMEGSAPARSDAANMAPCRQSAGNLQLLYTPFLDQVVEGAFHVAGDPLAEGV
jgi:hypothetical protein